MALLSDEVRMRTRRCMVLTLGSFWMCEYGKVIYIIGSLTGNEHDRT